MGWIKHWAIGGAIFGFVIGFGACTKSFLWDKDHFGDALMTWFWVFVLSIAGAIAIRKWILRVFWE